MSAPQDPLRAPENCGHQRIERFTGGDNAFSIWACGDCKLRFYPACPACVDVGHRNVVHPALPAEPQPPIDARKLVVAWFHDSEEICEHDEPPWGCEIMADHLLAAFTVTVRDWKAYASDNRRSGVPA